MQEADRAFLLGYPTEPGVQDTGPTLDTMVGQGQNPNGKKESRGGRVEGQSNLLEDPSANDLKFLETMSSNGINTLETQSGHGINTILEVDGVRSPTQMQQNQRHINLNGQGLKTQRKANGSNLSILEEMSGHGLESNGFRLFASKSPSGHGLNTQEVSGSHGLKSLEVLGAHSQSTLDSLGGCDFRPLGDRIGLSIFEAKSLNEMGCHGVSNPEYQQMMTLQVII